MSYYLYIIYSKKLDRYYVGHTEGLQKRIVQHNSGISEFTSSASDWAIVHSEEFASRELARSREMAIKKKKSRKYIAWLISSFG